ncbi:hypothetical protein MKW98_013420 [Papaver atlanticum]|uniref:Uncharacterized protein n=1 Tax=Papaver atlanticum TaxID=357466 RepID=A0AAD4XKK5_9MAGN|nr:hypothetical protein MKW98_013420 [Papaver atlanticum]
MAAAAKISLFLGCIIASILVQSMGSNTALPHVCTGYAGYVPWNWGNGCGGTAVVTSYQDYAYQTCSSWCLISMVHVNPEFEVMCAQIHYEEETGKHVCTCYSECLD